MGSTGSRRTTNTTSSTTGTPTLPKAVLKWADDGARRMPVANSLQAIEAGRKQRTALIQRSGRASTRLAGTTPYVNTSIGGTQ